MLDSPGRLLQIAGNCGTIHHGHGPGAEGAGQLASCLPAHPGSQRVLCSQAHTAPFLPRQEPPRRPHSLNSAGCSGESAQAENSLGGLSGQTPWGGASGRSPQGQVVLGWTEAGWCRPHSGKLWGLRHLDLEHAVSSGKAMALGPGLRHLSASPV